MICLRTMKPYLIHIEYIIMLHTNNAYICLLKLLISIFLDEYHLSSKLVCADIN